MRATVSALILSAALCASPSARADSQFPSARADSQSPSARADSQSPSARADSQSPSARADSQSPSARPDNQLLPDILPGMEAAVPSKLAAKTLLLGAAHAGRNLVAVGQW